MNVDSGDGGDGSAVDVAALSALQMCLASRAHDAGNGVDGAHVDASHATDAPGIDAFVDAGVPDVPTVGMDAGDSGTGAVQLALGDQYSCARLSDGSVRCWGDNEFGQMADGTTVSHLMPTKILGVPSALELAAGGRHVCVQSSDGAARCWGRDIEGQLGVGQSLFTPQLPSVAVCVIGSAQLALGGVHSCVRFMPGDMACWGSNAYGQVGDGTQTDRPLATEVRAMSGVMQIALGDSHTCALLSDGTVRCWGNDTFGQLGIGAAMMSVGTPSTVPGLANVAQIATGGFHSCALKQNGTVSCWGHNNAGQLGDGTQTDQYMPVDVAGLSGVAQLALGSAHTCARMTDGTVECWGWNQSGQLGNATASVEPMPSPVVGLSSVVEIAAGGEHMCARAMDGTVLCWGDNEHGQLGDGTHTLHSSPSAVQWGP